MPIYRSASLRMRSHLRWADSSCQPSSPTRLGWHRSINPQTSSPSYNSITRVYISWCNLVTPLPLSLLLGKHFSPSDINTSSPHGPPPPLSSSVFPFLLLHFFPSSHIPLWPLIFYKDKPRNHNWLAIFEKKPL